MVSRLLLSTTAASQMIVPTFSALLTLATTGSVSVLPVSTLQTEPVPFKPEHAHSLPILHDTSSNEQVDFVTINTSEATATNSPEVTPQLWERCFTLGHGPVIQTPAASLPTADTPFTLGHGPVVVSTSTPGASPSVGEPPFTLGYGPVVISKSTSIACMPIEGRPSTLQHGPVSISTSVVAQTVRRENVESASPTATSTLSTVVQKSSTRKIVRSTSLPEQSGITEIESDTESAAGNNIQGWLSKSWQWLTGWLGHQPKHTNTSSENAVNASNDYPGPPKYMLTDCHLDNGDYVYFTVLSPNGSLARDSKGEKALHYVKTSWSLTYPETLRKALFNDLEGFLGCPNGHCISKVIPGTDLRLKYVRNPNVFRAGWHQGHCGYLDNVQMISKRLVRLGEFGYLYAGGAPQLAVVDFVEQQMLTTYPALEISLICGFTVGLIVAGILLFLLWSSLIGICADLCAVVRASSDGAKKCAAKVRNASLKRPGRRNKYYGAAQAYESAEHYPLQSHLHSTDVATPPPAYSSMEPSRVLLEAEDSAKRPRRPCGLH